MIKNAVTLAILGTCIASTSFAFNVLHPLHKHNSATVVHVKKNIQTKNESFTDFSNTWTGTCSFDGQEDAETDTIAIYNDAFQIDLGGQAYSLQGELNTESGSSNRGTDFSHISMHWNAEKTQIIANIAGIDIEHDGSGNLETMLASTTFSLVNGQLIVEGNFHTLPESGQHTYKCVYNKA